MEGNAKYLCRLPVGWRDEDGTVHRDVTLRPAMVRDELKALKDFRVYLRPESLSAVLLSRAITSFGPLARVDPGILERLDPADIEALERAYGEVNGYEVFGGPGGFFTTEDTERNTEGTEEEKRRGGKGRGGEGREGEKRRREEEKSC